MPFDKWAYHIGAKAEFSQLRGKAQLSEIILEIAPAPFDFRLPGRTAVADNAVLNTKPCRKKLGRQS